MILLLTRLPGTGKSYLGRALAEQIGADVLDRDDMRNAIFPARDLDYSPEQNELASQVAYRVAEYILRRNPSRVLILDGRPFSRKEQVDEVAAIADAVNHQLRIVYCTAPEEVVRKRLEADLLDTNNAAAGRTIEKYRNIRQVFEPLTYPHIVVDTSLPLEECIEAITQYIAE